MDEKDDESTCEYCDEGQVDCPECAGSGEEEYVCDSCGDLHFHTCAECEGSGKIECEDCDGGRMIDEADNETSKRP